LPVLTLKPAKLPSNPADDCGVFDENRRATGRIKRTAGMRQITTMVLAAL